MRTLFGQRPAPKAVAPIVSATATSQGRTQPAQRVPSPVMADGNYPTRLFTVFTVPGDEVKQVFTASVEWTRVKVMLQTAGPVAISTNQQFTPTLSGKGLILQTGVPVEFELARGNNLYISSPAINRIAVIVQPIAWAEQMMGGIVRGVAGIATAVGGVQAAVAALAGVFRK